MTVQDVIREFGQHFPLLREGNFRVTSPEDENYNCIAWAAGSSTHWWWPDPNGLAHWPTTPRTVTIEAFVQAYQSLGYHHRSNSELEANQTKIAIYTLQGKPTHAARQLIDGWWASKLGVSVDIEHELEALNGPTYGQVEVILSKSIV